MEGILLVSGAYATILPIILGLLVLGLGIAGIVLGHASDAEWPVTGERKPDAPEAEKKDVRKAA